MLITNNNIELRNLQEQVQKNKEDIARHYEIDRTLANFGIKIVGTVETVNELPDSTLYEGEYGDGYAVGQAGSYTYYIFTRPDPNQGIDTNYWLDVGQLAIQGPQGPEGPQGPQGEKGDATMWYTSSAEGANAKPGDLWLMKDGTIVKKSTDSGVWNTVTNIKGPQGIQGIQGEKGEQGETGPQGPKGDTGDVGGFINIAGVLTSTTQLPLPSQIKNLTIAYLVGTSTPQDLYIQVGSDSATAIWENMGPLNVATYVTVNGQFQNVWNADTKLDVKPQTNLSIYGQNIAGPTMLGTYYQFTNEATNPNGTIPQYHKNQLSVGQPVDGTDCINLNYFNANVGKKLYKHSITIEEAMSGAFPVENISFISQDNTPISKKDDLYQRLPSGQYLGGNNSVKIYYWSTYGYFDIFTLTSNGISFNNLELNYYEDSDLYIYDTVTEL